MVIKGTNLDDRPNPHDLEMVERARRAVHDVAAGILAGELTYLEGARLICAKRPFCSAAEDDPDFDAFISVLSDSDHLPVGPERRNWGEDALLRLQPEIAAAEQRAATLAKTAAQNLALRYGGTPA
jgi:hypothetical protein